MPQACIRYTSGGDGGVFQCSTVTQNLKSAWYPKQLPQKCTLAVFRILRKNGPYYANILAKIQNISYKILNQNVVYDFFTTYSGSQTACAAK